MKSEHFQEALVILTTNYAINVSFNEPIENHVSRVHTILIHRSNATVIKKLVEAGFSLNMTDKGLAVDKY